MNNFFTGKLHLIVPPLRTACLLLLLCSSFHAYAQHPKVGLDADVQSCQFLGQIEGKSGYGKHADWRDPAKYAAMTEAEKLTATHIVWVKFDAIGGFNGTAIAKAYRCQAI